MPSDAKVMHSWKAGGVPACLTVTGRDHVRRAQDKDGAVLNLAVAVDQFKDGTCSTCLPACDTLPLGTALPTLPTFQACSFTCNV